MKRKKLSLAKQQLLLEKQQVQQQQNMLGDNQKMLGDMIRIAVAIERFEKAQHIAHQQMVRVTEGQGSVSGRISRIETIVDRAEQLHLSLAKVVSSLLRKTKNDIPPKYRKQIDAIARRAKADG